MRNTEMQHARGVTSVAFTFAFAYAVTRYVIFGAVAPDQVPLFILNKALAVAATLILCACLALGPLSRIGVAPKAWLRARKGLGLHGFALAAAHVLITLSILSPALYGKLYQAEGMPNLWGGLAILGGVAAIMLLVVPAVTSIGAIRKGMTPADWISAQRLGVSALAATFGHVAALGWKTWLTPEKWAAGMPPLTLVGIAAIALMFVIRALANTKLSDVAAAAATSSSPRRTPA